MKQAKQIASLLLVLVLVFSMVSTVFAADSPAYTIEVTNSNTSISIDGITYSAYKLFNVTYAGEAHSYTITDEFKSFTYVDKSGEALIAYVAALEDNAKELDAFAKAALEYATENQIEAAGSAAATEETATISVATAGYYLIAGTATTNEGQTVTAACSLDTTNPTAEVHVKADAPTIDKVIVNADDGNSNGTSVNVGDVVDFKLTSKVPNMTGYETYQYIVHDTMSAGLTFNNDVAVKIGDAVLASSDYTVVADGQSFTITISDLTVYTEDAAIEITYSATLNSHALTTDVEKNTVNLEYSNNPNNTTSTTTTPDDVVYVYDFDIVIDKYVDGHTGQKLADAQFVLYKVEGENKQYYKLANGKVTWVTTEAEATVVTTNAQGEASFTGLDAGTYYLHETKAPDGYNQLKDDIKVEITATYTDSGTLATTNTSHTDNGQYSITQGIANSTGSELPETGGMGTTLFYAIGGILVLAAVVLLVTKKRMSAAN